jgi:hypothetical protein
MENYTYLSPQQIVKSGRYPLSMGQMRHLLHCRHRNGLNRAIRKIGKRLVVRIDLFDSWIESHASQKKSSKASL